MMPADTPSPVRDGSVTVTGSGWADAAPDVAVVSIGVECRRDSVEAAYSAAGSALAAVTAALHGQGVAPADLRTAGLNVRADLVWREGEGQRVAGYVAASSLAVQLRDVAAASRMISDATAAGGNDVRLNGLTFSISDPSAVKERARAAAWEDARAAAAQYAALASATLGSVLSVSELPAGQGPVPVAGIQRMAAAESVSVEPGESRVDAAVTVVWELIAGQ